MSLTESSAIDVAKAASSASRHLATLSEADRNEALTALHDALLTNKDAILEANARDLRTAKQCVDGASPSHSVLKRLDLSRPGKYDDMLQGILSVRNLKDPSMFAPQARGISRLCLFFQCGFLISFKLATLR